MQDDATHADTMQEQAGGRVDYDRLLDEEVLAFVARTLSFYPADLDPGDWTAQRRVYDAMAASFHNGRPEGLKVSDGEIAGVPVRHYGEDTRVSTGANAGAKSEVTILFAHGGGFVLGGLESHDDICAEMAAETGCHLVSVDYRLAPEHLHPAASEDFAAVADALRAEGPVVLCGDSAGGALCAAYCGTRGGPDLRGQVLIYPSCGYPQDGGSFVTHAHAPLLTSEEMKGYNAALGVAPDDARMIAAKGDFTRVPRTRAFAAECDPLADDCPRYVADLTAAGVDARWTLDRGLVHGWLRARHCSTRASEAFQGILSALKELTR